jgi:hypothetical protein
MVSSLSVAPTTSALLTDAGEYLQASFPWLPAIVVLIRYKEQDML